MVIPDVGAQSPADMPAFMSALFAGPINIWQIDTERIIDAERNPKDIDVYRYNAGEVVMVMASVAPSAMVAVLPTLTVQVDSPFDDSTVTQDSVFRILYMGTNVVLVRVVASYLQENPETNYVSYAFSALPIGVTAGIEEFFCHHD